MLTGTLFDLVPVALALSRLSDGTFVRVNDKFCGMFGFTSEEMLSRTSAELMLFPEGADRRPLVADVLAEGRVRNREVVMRRKDGAPLIVLTNIDLVEIHGEKHLLTSNLDITDRKWLEGVLQRVQQASASHAPIGGELDPAPIAGLLEDLGAADLVALLDTFFDFAPKLAERMDNGAQREDRDAINRAAHMLKSNAAMLGAITLSDLCQRMETDAVTAPWTQLRGQVEEAKRLLGNALAELKQERSRLKRS